MTPTTEDPTHPPTRILHVIVDLTAGGAELMLARLVRAHHYSSGYEHRIVSLRSLGDVGPGLEADGIEVEALGLNSPLGLPAALTKLIRNISRRPPDIVQTWMYHGDLFGGFAARIAGIKAVVWGVRIAEISAKFGISRITGLIRRACALASGTIPDRIVYVAESARISHEKLGYDPSKSVVIRNGYSMPPMVHGHSRHVLMDEFGIPDDALLVGSAGRYNRQKNHRSFIAACAKVAQAVPSARFVLFGRNVDPDNLELRQWISQTGYADRFHLAGHRTDLLECFVDLDVFCLHSISEGFPNVVAEAMSVGVPCVVTDVGDAADLVANTGRVVPPADDDLLAQALLDMIALDAEDRLRLGREARSRVEQRFSMRAILSEYERLYADVLNGRSPAMPIAAGTYAQERTS